MFLDSINIHSLRVFEAVYRHSNMTKAAEELHMTQSGVSQHIKNLEDNLGVVLFERIKQRPIPTSVASELARACLRHLHGLNRDLLSLTGHEEEVRGPVHVGLPLEFGNNLVLPLLARIGRQYPLVSFVIKYGHASEMNGLLLQGKLDFAFIDNYQVDRPLVTKRVRDEILCLCCSQDYFNHAIKSASSVKNNEKFYATLDFVDYIEGAPVLNLWFEHHLKKSIDINVRASLMDVQGIGRIISEGLGAGILPLHVIERMQAQGKELYIFAGRGTPLLNTISVVYLDGRHQSRAATVVQDLLLAELSK
jgi:DNA-binding transcriptional LysR family regulator